MALNVKTGGNPNVAGIDKSSSDKKMVLNVNKGSNIYVSVCIDKRGMICNFSMLSILKKDIYNLTPLAN